MEKYQDLFDLFAQQYNMVLLQSEMDAIVKACEPFYMGHGGSGVTDEQIKEAAFKNANEFPHYFTETSHNVAFHYGATWANDQNAARIAELEAMLSKSAFNLDGHIILLQAANQQIEKERQRISELEEQKAELIDGLFFALNAIVAWELKGGPKKQIIERIEKIIEKHSTKFPF